MWFVAIAATILASCEASQGRLSKSQFHTYIEQLVANLTQEKTEEFLELLSASVKVWMWEGLQGTPTLVHMHISAKQTRIAQQCTHTCTHTHMDTYVHIQHTILAHTHAQRLHTHTHTQLTFEELHRSKERTRLLGKISYLGRTGGLCPETAMLAAIGAIQEVRRWEELDEEVGGQVNSGRG